MNQPPGISVVMPIRNEERHLRSAVERVLVQNYAGPLEILLAVGPSQDATEQVAAQLAAEDPRVRIVPNPTGYTPAGLNLALKQASHNIIMRVDGHGELCDDYITIAVETMAATGAANVGGLMDARGTSPFEEAVAAAYNSRAGLGGGGFHLEDTPEGPAETVFLGCFKRQALEAAGGFDETMHRAQDWELNYRLRRAGQQVWFTPRMRVTYRPRSSLRALAGQFYRTGQWRREVMRRHPETASLRYLAPPLAVAGIGTGLLGGVLGLLLRAPVLRGMFLLPLIYLGFVAVASGLVRDVSPAARLRLPAVLVTMHVCWGLGFLTGLPRSVRANR